MVARTEKGVIFPRFTRTLGQKPKTTESSRDENCTAPRAYWPASQPSIMTRDRTIELAKRFRLLSRASAQRRMRRVFFLGKNNSDKNFVPTRNGLRPCVAETTVSRCVIVARDLNRDVIYFPYGYRALFFSFFTPTENALRPTRW